jgi:hypothetical protein
MIILDTQSPDSIRAKYALLKRCRGLNRHLALAVVEETPSLLNQIKHPVTGIAELAPADRHEAGVFQLWFKAVEVVHPEMSAMAKVLPDEGDYVFPVAPT